MDLQRRTICWTPTWNERQGSVGLEHLLGVEVAGLSQARRVVGEKSRVDQVRRGLGAVDAARLDASALEPLRSFVRGVRRAGTLAMLGGALLLALVARSGCLALAVAVGPGNPG